MKSARSSGAKSNRFRFKILEGDDTTIRKRQMNASSPSERLIESSVASSPSVHRIASSVESPVDSPPSEHRIDSPIAPPPSEHPNDSSINSSNGVAHGVVSLLFSSDNRLVNTSEHVVTADISQSITNVIKPDETWDYKTFAHDGYKFNDTQLAIIYNVLKHGSTSPPILKPISNPKKFYENPLIYSYNTITNDFHTLYRTYYTTNSDKPELTDSLLDTYNYIDQGRNLYIQNCYRATIYNAIAENTIIPIASRSSKDERVVLPFTDVDYILTRIRNCYFKQRNQNVDRTITELQSLILSQAVLKSNPIIYVKRHSPTSYKSPGIKEVYGLAVIPKELQLKFDRPGKFFNEFKQLLTLNPDDGFYTYNLNGMMIPILCTHEYMLYEGKSLSLISLECYKNGKCKYCGQELLAYHIQFRETLPPKVYDLIYKYMNTINENIEETALLNVLFQLLHDAIDKNVTGNNVKNYDTAIIAFTALYLYIIYMKTKNDISYNSKINNFIDSANNYWTEVGWTDKDIEEAIDDENICSNLSNITEIIKEKIYTNEFKFIDLLPVAILFNTIIALKDYYSIAANTPSQKLWKSKEGMKRFNLLLRSAYLSLWGNVIFKNSLSKLQNKHILISSSRFDIKPTVVKYGQRFFDSTCLYYCPVNHIHEWSLKKECLHCGLKFNKSNVSEVYNKYQYIINNSFLQHPKTLPSERFHLDKLHHVKDILAYDANSLFEKYINIDNAILRNVILKSMDHLDRVNEYIKFISVVTTIDISELNAIDDKKTLILKALSFIIDKGIKSKENVIAEIKNITFKISNIELLLM